MKIHVIHVKDRNTHAGATTRNNLNVHSYHTYLSRHVSFLIQFSIIMEAIVASVIMVDTVVKKVMLMVHLAHRVEKSSLSSTEIQVVFALLGMT